MIKENLHQVCSLGSTLNANPFKNAPVHYNCDKFNNSDKDRIAVSPRFSVFEPLKDTFVASQKYIDMSMAVNNTSRPSESLSIFSKSFSNPKKSEAISSPDNFRNVELAQNPYGNNHSREVHFAIKAKMNLAHELIKIEKEKWPQSLKKCKHSQLSRTTCSKKKTH